MVLTRTQIENLSREELIEELLQLSDMSIQLQAISKHKKLKSDLLITKNCNILLQQRIVQLE